MIGSWGIRRPVPAWNFYGKMTTLWNQPPETSVDADYDAGPESLLTINAIDDSVIEN